MRPRRSGSSTDSTDDSPRDCTPEARAERTGSLSASALLQRVRPDSLRLADGVGWAAWSSDSIQYAQSSDSLVRVPASERELAGGMTWSQYLLRPIRFVRALASPTAPEGLRYCAMVERALSAGEGASSPSAAAPVSRALLPDGGETVCAICTEPLLPGERVQPMMGCIHLFHSSCIEGHIQARCQSASQDAALESVVLCPLCRGPMLACSEEQLPEEERRFAAPLGAEEHLTGEERQLAASAGAEDAPEPGGAGTPLSTGSVVLAPARSSWRR